MIKKIYLGKRTKKNSALKSIGVFDSHWYLAQNRDVAELDYDPLKHYLSHGEKEGRKPHRYFDVDFYIKKHRSEIKDNQTALEHYLENSKKSGFNPNPYFDTDWYLSKYDVGSISPLEHFIVNELSHEFKPHPLWDCRLYLEANHDIYQLIQQNKLFSAYSHFIEFGAGELDNNEHRQLRFRWGNLVLSYNKLNYMQANHDVAVAIERGLVKSSLEHLFTVGFYQALRGLRAIYGPEYIVTARKVLSGDDETSVGRYLVLFAHYDPMGVVDNHVLKYLRALKSCMCDIIFITAGYSESLNEVKPYVKEIIIKMRLAEILGLGILL